MFSFLRRIRKSKNLFGSIARIFAIWPQRCNSLQNGYKTYKTRMTAFGRICSHRELRGSSRTGVLAPGLDTGSVRDEANGSGCDFLPTNLKNGTKHFTKQFTKRYKMVQNSRKFYKTPSRVTQLPRECSPEPATSQASARHHRPGFCSLWEP